MLTAFNSLLKIRITLSVGFISATGWYVAHQGWGRINDFLVMLVVTLLVCSGVCALNHVAEWRSDSLMNRTRNRPIPSGEIGFYPALLIGILLTLGGLIWMGLTLGRGMVVGATVTGIIYLFIYTPLKKVTWLNTTIGAIPGALPIMGGWYAARGELDWEGWTLLLVMFFWQHPHFYAIAWICQKDYEKAGYRMLVKDDKSGRVTFTHSLLHTVLLTISSMTLVFTDFAGGWVYLIAVMLLNLIFLFWVFSGYISPVEKKNQIAQKILNFSVWYQILFFIFIIADINFRVRIL